MQEPGTSRDKRVIAALSNIGPAVLNGGISTFLAFILLAGSRSHVFLSFFKIFFLVVMFGLYQGLVVLPVVLSLFGPASSASPDTPTDTDDDIDVKDDNNQQETAGAAAEVVDDDSAAEKPVLSANGFRESRI